MTGGGGSGARFSERAWERTAELRAAIDASPFLAQLSDGTLPAATFRHYLEQDTIYLAGYGRALALLAARAPDPTAAGFWAGSAQGAAVVEASLHGDLLASGALGPAAATAAEASPTTLGYVSHLVATAATAPYAVAAAAVLPCFWIYADVAARLAVSASVAGSDHPYARWIAAYDADGFTESVRRARDLVDAAADPADVDTQEAMFTAFATATRYELMFWDTALVHEDWPLPLAGGG